MIQAILLSLKIIGITVLVLLCLILFVLALILFVPVFYRVKVVHNQEGTQVNGRVRYLFPLLSVTVQYLKKITYRIRVFGMVVLDSERPKKPKHQKPKKQKRRTKKRKKAPGKKIKQLSVTESCEEELSVPMLSAEDTVNEERDEKKHRETTGPGLFEKIRLKFKKIWETILTVINKLQKVLHQKEELQRILSNPSTKQAVVFAWGELKHLLKHILPRKMKGYVVYGADDPATTGQVLGILSVFYAKTGYLVEIRPNFEQAEFQCEVELRGHIQVVTLLVIAVKLLLHQELRKVISELKHVKEIE